jgi:hypothetical protein
MEHISKQGVSGAVEPKKAEKTPSKQENKPEKGKSIPSGEENDKKKLKFNPTHTAGDAAGRRPLHAAPLCVVNGFEEML